MAGIINLAQPTNRVTGHINRSGRIDCETAMRKAAKLQVFSIDPPHNKSRGSFRAEFAKATRERERERDGRELFRFVSRPTARERARNTRGNFEKLGNTSTKDGGKKENAAYLFFPSFRRMRRSRGRFPVTCGAIRCSNSHRKRFIFPSNEP